MSLVVRNNMRIFVAAFLAAIACGCATPVHPVDGKLIVLNGRWNSHSKDDGQIVCTAEPKVVDVFGIEGRAVPEQDQLVRVRAVLHWRGATAKEKLSAEKNADQLPSDGYVIDW